MLIGGQQERLSTAEAEVPQAAEFTYVFTQEISTHIPVYHCNTGQHGLSDLNKRNFQPEFS